jgi:hypothetical protein
MRLRRLGITARPCCSFDFFGHTLELVATTIYAGGNGANGSSTGMPIGTKCRMLRDRIVKPWCRAVAVMMISPNPRACP